MQKIIMIFLGGTNKKILLLLKADKKSDRQFQILKLK
jgi:hypothetical protein